jgi:hypothetical protein
LQPILKLLSCFAPNLTPVCERCVLPHSHHFDIFYMERQPYILHSLLRLVALQSFIITLSELHKTVTVESEGLGHDERSEDSKGPSSTTCLVKRV